LESKVDTPIIAKVPIEIPTGFALIRVHGENLVVKTDSFEWAILNDAAIDSLHHFDEDLVFQRDPQPYGDPISHFGSDNMSQCCAQKTKHRKQKLAPSIVVLHTSNACNMRCTYCYANATVGRTMSMTTARRVIDRVWEHSNHPCILEFHGGEPLLNFGFIRQAIDYASTKTTDDGRQMFSYSLQTNGTLITNEVADFLADRHVSTGVSIDGFASVHDAARVFPDGTGSYQQVVAGIQRLQSAGVSFSVLCVIKELSAVDDLLQFAEAHNLDSIKISNYVRQGRAVLEAPLNWSCEDFSARVLALIDRIIDHNRSASSRIHILNVSLLLRKILTGESGSICMRFPCGAGDSMIAIDIDGSVYPCEEMVGKSELVIGNIEDSSVEQMLSDGVAIQLRNRAINQFEECKNCYLKSICPVNCANQSYNKNRRFTNRSELCGYYQVMIPELIWRIHNDAVGAATLL